MGDNIEECIKCHQGLDIGLVKGLGGPDFITVIFENKVLIDHLITHVCRCACAFLTMCQSIFLRLVATFFPKDSMRIDYVRNHYNVVFEEIAKL